NSLQEAPAPDDKSVRLLGLHPGDELPAQLEWRIERGVRFVATLDGWRSQEGAGEHEAVCLRVLRDGLELRAIVLHPGDPVQPLEVELPAGSRFVLETAPVAGSAGSCWARFTNAEFR